SPTHRGALPRRDAPPRAADGASPGADARARPVAAPDGGAGLLVPALAGSSRPSTPHAVAIREDANSIAAGSSRPSSRSTASILGTSAGESGVSGSRRWGS